MNKAELIKNNQDNLIMLRALGLFFFNFTQDAIDELKENSREFKHVWEKLAQKATEEEWGHIPEGEFYSLFYSQMSYHTQALIIEKAIEVYGEEARKGAARSLEFASHA